MRKAVRAEKDPKTQGCGKCAEMKNHKKARLRVSFTKPCYYWLKMVDDRGIEPLTSSVSRKRSTSELTVHILPLVSIAGDCNYVNPHAENSCLYSSDWRMRQRETVCYGLLPHGDSLFVASCAGRAG